MSHQFPLPDLETLLSHYEQHEAGSIGFVSSVDIANPSKILPPGTNWDDYRFVDEHGKELIMKIHEETKSDAIPTVEKPVVANSDNILSSVSPVCIGAGASVSGNGGVAIGCTAQVLASANGVGIALGDGAVCSTSGAIGLPGAFFNGVSGGNQSVSAPGSQAGLLSIQIGGNNYFVPFFNSA